MATPAPIYASSPGLLVSKNPADTQVVLIPPASTIASQLIVRDASGTASLANPIVVSTTQGALFTGGASTFYISDPYSAFATAALSPSLYMPLYAPSSQPSFQPTFRYGTESNFTPQYQYISTAYNPASFQAISSTALYGTLVNGAPLFTTADSAFRFQAQSLSTGHLSTADLTVDTRYTAGSAQTTSSYSAYLSAGVGLLSSLTTDSMSVEGTATLQSTLRTAGSLDVGGNFSMAGPAVFADVSANGYWSTLGTIGVGGDVSGFSFNAGSSTIVGGGAYSSGPYYVSAATVAATLSTVLASASTAVYSGGLGVGITPGTALSATVDVSGSAAVSDALTASGISTSVLSSATAILSSATLRDINTPYSAYDLKVQGGQLYVGATALGGGGGAVSAEFVGNSFTATNYLYGTSTITSTFTVGSTIVNPDFDVAVYGNAHTSSIYGDNRKSTLWVAVGNATRPDLGITSAYRSSIRYSWNGSNDWFPAQIGGFCEGQDVAWNGKMWVAVGHVSNASPAGLGNSRSTIQWSLDGSNWSNCLAGGGFNGPAGGWGISWNGRMWIATGQYSINHPRSSIQYSFDGSNFRAIQTATNFLSNNATLGNITFRAEWNGRMWIAGRAGNSGTAAQSNACFSYDGLNWSNLTISTIGGPVASVQWNGRYWLAMGQTSGGTDATNENSVAISSNGFNWVSSVQTTFGAYNSDGAGTISYNQTTHAHRAVWNGQFWVGVGVGPQTGIQISYNGLNWFSSAGSYRGTATAVFDCFQTGTNTTYYIPTTNYNHFGGGRGIAWNGNIYVATGFYDSGNGLPSGAVSSSRQTIQWSLNGINWNPITNNTGFGNGAFGAAGNQNGNAVAWQSNCQTDISFPGQDIITSRTQQTYQSTSQIYSLSSLITFGQTLFVDSSRQTAINTYYSSISTQYLFYVDGSMLTYGAAKQGGAATWTAVSDERVKQDIQDADISACYHAVRGLHVHNYKYKDSYIQKYKLPAKPRYGLYAEEVEQVIPEAVLNTDVLGEQVKMLDMEPVNMLHYGATSYLYSTLKHHTSTIAGGHTYITAAGPLQDISGAFHTSYANRPALLSNLTELYAAHASNYQ